MAILQFAFGTDPQAPDFRPHNYTHNLVVYTGTHDNDTTVGWWTGEAGHSTRTDEDIREEREYARTIPRPRRSATIHWEFIRAVMASVANTAIVPAQDLLGLGSDARMNRPGTASGNWRWRLTPGQLTPDVMRHLGELAETYEQCKGPLRRFFLSCLDDATHEADADDHQGAGDDPDLTDTHA